MSTVKDNNTFKKTSFLAGNNSSFIEEFYLDYLQNPEKLPKGWKLFFDGLKDNHDTISKNLRGPSWSRAKVNLLKIEKNKNNISEQTSDQIFDKKSTQESIKAIALIRAYRIRGHLIANLDPLGMMERKYLEDLHPADHGFKTVSYTHLTLPTSDLV